ncbi:MAG: DUF167 domain-containing protein [Armatimonadetes bacterium]|nr:DUF167 domain-containing protein [Armatimonadota bacterium]
MAQISIRVTPKASQNKIEFGENGCKVWVTASPTDGEANEAVIELIAKTLRVAKSTLAVVSGGHSREKVIDLGSFSVEDLKLASEQVRKRR